MATIRRWVLLLLLLAPAVSCAAVLRVYVSVLPLKALVERVGGEAVEVRVMVRPGHSPATYEPTPQQVSALAGTDLYVRVGVPFETAWMERIRSANPRMRVVDARAGLALRGPVHHNHGHEGERAGRHPPAEQDPHVWTSPLLAGRMAATVRDRLIELDPAHRQDYMRNHAAFTTELERLDREIRALLGDLPSRKFLVFHPAWGYFADAYGLIQVSIESGGKVPGARTLAGVIEQAQRDGIKSVFVQPQFDRRQAEQVARAIGGRVVVADPLAADYPENLLRVARQIAGALRP